jgi:hypothetical protein
MTDRLLTAGPVVDRTRRHLLSRRSPQRWRTRSVYWCRCAVAGFLAPVRLGLVRRADKRAVVAVFGGDVDDVLHAEGHFVHEQLVADRYLIGFNVMKRGLAGTVEKRDDDEVAHCWSSMSLRRAPDNGPNGLPDGPQAIRPTRQARAAVRSRAAGRSSLRLSPHGAALYLPPGTRLHTLWWGSRHGYRLPQRSAAPTLTTCATWSARATATWWRCPPRPPGRGPA